MNTIVKLKSLCTLLIFSLILISCKKEKTQDCSVSKENLSGTYTITSVKLSVPNTPDKDILYKECQKDNLVILKSDGTYTIEDAGTACNPIENATGTWELNGNTLKSDKIFLNGSIQNFDCKTLTIVDKSEAEGTMVTTVLTKTE